MALSEENKHAFVVRIWCEPREIEGKTPAWRGMIEHVASRNRQYLEDINEINTFIVPYLKQMGIEI